jgi:hypothetical protein
MTDVELTDADVDEIGVALSNDVGPAYAELCVNKLRHLRIENRKLSDDAEQLRVQLAGCSAAALGYGGDCKRGDYGWSASFGDVMSLRGDLEMARTDNASLLRKLAEVTRVARWAEILLREIAPEVAEQIRIALGEAATKETH